MNIQDLEHCSVTWNIKREGNHIRGKGKSNTAGYVATGDGVAIAGTYAGAVGDSTATSAHVSVRTHQGSWSRLSKAQARANARAISGRDRSSSSFSARSTHFGFSGGFIQLSSASAFDSH